MKRQGQIWSLDFIVSLAIFFFAITLVYVFVIQNTESDSETISELSQDAHSISTVLLSQGVPANWTVNTVVIPGILSSQNNISHYKFQELAQVYAASNIQFKQLLGTRHNVFLEHLYLNSSTIQSLGLKPTEADFLVQSTRYVVYNETITKLRVLVWS